MGSRSPELRNGTRDPRGHPPQPLHSTRSPQLHALNSANAPQLAMNDALYKKCSQVDVLYMTRAGSLDTAGMLYKFNAPRFARLCLSISLCLEALVSHLPKFQKHNSKSIKNENSQNEDQRKTLSCHWRACLLVV